MRATAAALACWLVLAIPRESPAVESPLDVILDRCRALRTTAIAEMSSTQAICLAELNHGRFLGLWTEEEARFEANRIQKIFEIPSTQVPQNGRGLSPAMIDEIFRRAAKPSDVSTATSPVASWLDARMRCLNTLRTDAQYQFCLAAVSRAEEIWLTAQNGGDLEPARLILNEALVFTYLSATNFARTRNSQERYRQDLSPYPDPFREIAAEVVDAIGVIRSRSPRYFFEAETDPAELAGTREIWGALQRIGHRTLRRPRIAKRIEELNSHFLQACRAADNALDEAILRDAPAAEFERLWQQAKAFRTPHLPQFNSADSNPIFPVPPPNFRPPVTIDYLNWIQVSVPDPMDPFQTPSERHPPGPLDAPEQLSVGYEWWLQWRQAVEAGDRPAQTEEARQRLLSVVTRFPASVAGEVVVRLAPPPSQPATSEPSPPSPALAGASAIARLVSALESLNATTGNSERYTAPTELIDAWRGLESPSIKARPQPRQFNHFWTMAATDPARKILFQLRNEGAREALKKLALPKDVIESPETPLTALIAESLEAACLDNRVDIAAQILAINEAGCFLLSAEHARYVQTVDLLTRAQGSGAPNQNDQAKFSHAQLLRITTSLELATRIARELKSAAPSQPAVPRR